MELYVHLSKMTRDGVAKIRNLAPEYGKWRSFVQSLGAKVIYAAACFWRVRLRGGGGLSERSGGAERVWMRDGTWRCSSSDPSSLLHRGLHQGNECSRNSSRLPMFVRRADSKTATGTGTRCEISIMRSEDEADALGAATDDDALVVALVGPCVAPLKAANAPSVGTLTTKVERASVDALDAGAVDSGAMASTVARLVSRCAKWAPLRSDRSRAACAGPGFARGVATLADSFAISPRHSCRKAIKRVAPIAANATPGTATRRIRARLGEKAS
jgi:hypothetical protein